MRWALILLLLAGCAQEAPAVVDIGEPAIVACSDRIGQPTTAELLQAPCALPDGTTFYGGVSSCSNGITMLWNDSGWGYQDEPLQPHATWPTHGCSGE